MHMSRSTDCGMPGGFCKEQCTWDGLVRLLYHRRSSGLDWKTLHCAKVSLEQYGEAAGQMKIEDARVRVPHFLVPLEPYRQRLEQIARDNGLSSWLAAPNTPLHFRPPAVRTLPPAAGERLAPATRHPTSIAEGREGRKGLEERLIATLNLEPRTLNPEGAIKSRPQKDMHTSRHAYLKTWIPQDMDRSRHAYLRNNAVPVW
mmetsp:Transcript_83389/g.122059  ORF Transcript_83389/g.122059 Transcript_83389/m.122059 type:complete len:202 (-) Transcript_83389:79-684(-)